MILTLDINQASSGTRLHLKGITRTHATIKFLKPIKITIQSLKAPFKLRFHEHKFRFLLNNCSKHKQVVLFLCIHGRNYNLWAIEDDFMLISCLDVEKLDIRCDSDPFISSTQTEWTFGRNKSKYFPRKTSSVR